MGVTRVVCAVIQDDRGAFLATQRDSGSLAGLWEFPFKNSLGGSDTGIDIVCKTHDGGYWAVQCKCYKESTKIDKGAVDSFLATSSRQFQNEKGELTPFTHRLWISTSNNWGAHAEEALKNQTPPVSRLTSWQLESAPIDWAEEVGNPRYILDLILSVIHVSTQTVDIVDSLPEIDFES